MYYSKLVLQDDCSVPDPTVPEPTVPEPTVPEPTVPEPTVSEPTVLDPMAVLVLSTLDHANVPQVISFDGMVDADINFEYEESTESAHSCGTTLNGDFYVFGGSRFKRQVKHLEM